jgi:hypothetical protein
MGLATETQRHRGKKERIEIIRPVFFQESIRYRIRAGNAATVKARTYL